MPTELPLRAPTLATACYPANPQTLINEAFEKGAALAGDLTGVIISATAPDAEDRDKGWIKLTGTAPTAPPVVYVWFNAQWVAPNPSPASGNERRLWVGSEADIWSFDGGDGNDPSATPPSAAAGAMWEADDEFIGRVPIGVGLIPGSNPAETVAVANNYGAAQVDVTVVEANVPKHRHEVGVEGDGVASDAEDGRLRTGAGEEIDFQPNNSTSVVGLTRYWGGDATGATTPLSISTRPCSRGVFVIKRTARQYYVAS